MKKLFIKYAPPGADAGSEIKSYLIALCVMLLISFSFLSRFFRSLSAMYMTKYGVKVLIEGSQMPGINWLMKHSLCGFWCVFGECVFAAIEHYRSFTRESRSIYLMKRVKDPAELHIRCLTLPVLGIAAAAVFGLLLLAIYSLVYYHAAPAAVLPPRETLDIMGAFL